MEYTKVYLKVELQNLLKYEDKNNGATKGEALKMIEKMHDPTGIFNPFTATSRNSERRSKLRR